MSIKNQGKDKKEHEKKSQNPEDKKSTDVSVPKDNPSKSQAKGADVKNTKPEARNPEKGKGGKNDKRS